MLPSEFVLVNDISDVSQEEHTDVVFVVLGLSSSSLVDTEKSVEEVEVVSVSGHHVVYSVTTPFVVVVTVDNTAVVLCVVSIPDESVVVIGMTDVVQLSQ